MGDLIRNSRPPGMPPVPMRRQEGAVRLPTDEEAERWLRENDLYAVTHLHDAPDCAECTPPPAAPPLDVERLATAMEEFRYGPPGIPGPAAIEDAKAVAAIYARLSQQEDGDG